MDTKNLKDSLEKIGKDTVVMIVDELLKADKRATGDLINSIDYEVLQVANGLVLNILSAEYFKFVDEGRRPGAKMPPIRAIIPWVQAKGITFLNKKGVKISTESTAFLIAKNISKNGIKPLGIKRKVVNDILNNKAKYIEQGITIDINKYVNEEIFKINKKLE